MGRCRARSRVGGRTGEGGAFECRLDAENTVGGGGCIGITLHRLRWHSLVKAAQVPVPDKCVHGIVRDQFGALGYFGRASHDQVEVGVSRCLTLRRACALSPSRAAESVFAFLAQVAAPLRRSVWSGVAVRRTSKHLAKSRPFSLSKIPFWRRCESGRRNSYPLGKRSSWARRKPYGMPWSRNSASGGVGHLRAIS